MSLEEILSLVSLEETDRFGLEAVRRADARAASPTSPARSCPNRKSSPTITLQHVQLVDERRTSELFGRERGELAVERQHQRDVEAGLLEEPEALLDRREHARRLVRREHLERVRVERDDARTARPSAFGLDEHAVEQHAVTVVHAVEHPDGRNRRPRLGRTRVGAPQTSIGSGSAER